ncbi:MAG: hypothetical protein ABFS08_10395 [Pseudomonadota bacterium]
MSHNYDVTLAQLRQQLNTENDRQKRLAIYHHAISLTENQLWQHPDNNKLLTKYQQLFVELEKLRAKDRTLHNFIIVIPVADRPQHLEACLGSTLRLCETFGYGGKREGHYSKISVLVADDSREQHNIERHRKIAADYDHRGLTTLYFGQSEQLAQLDKLDDKTRAQLTPIIGNNPVDAFYHKGASMMRNIAYLKLNEMVANRDNTLIYFIDSDQEFQVKVQTEAGERNLYAINFFYQLDKIFRERDTTILTGKVVGDPPVSPSVMASNFLDDVTAFLSLIANTRANGACSFHGNQVQNSDDAAYHDMADLFGFKTKTNTFNYQCAITGEHDHTSCFADFTHKLNRFFDGEHPTRKSYYEHQLLADTINPARTIYTGNYIFRAEALRYFVPFATLKLRMAGPVLGRIIKSEIGEKFVSANLPMLHKRTVDEIGHSEFRPGINRKQQRVDLSVEFERQFFGDVMLFSMEQLTAQGYPAISLTTKQVESVVQEVEAQMLRNYTTKHEQIVEKITALRSLFEESEQWWQQTEALSQSRAEFSHFVTNMEFNFGDEASGYKLIHSAGHQAQRRHDIINAIIHYRNDRKTWESQLQ